MKLLKKVISTKIPLPFKKIKRKFCLFLNDESINNKLDPLPFLSSEGIEILKGKSCFKCQLLQRKKTSCGTVGTVRKISICDASSSVESYNRNLMFSLDET